ncbi:hypothetical protein AKJ09_01454 [Labilithrix luteola]|uniref:DUF1622 domain-containing protein n=1 Tax=Labilithrix luteola TaxID=1391654 RepID=A0A0K1PMN2_9BACT|nr:hypothetical protein AKJ09_01454 [Labilithrix luteola]
MVRAVASYIALALEVFAVFLVSLGGVRAAIGSVHALLRGRGTAFVSTKELFLGFASWLVLGLEFELAADIVRTAISPSWTDIGKLGAIAVIRTGLNLFLERDLDKYAAALRSAEAEPSQRP